MNYLSLTKLHLIIIIVVQSYILSQKMHKREPQMVKANILKKFHSLERDYAFISNNEGQSKII